MLKKNLQKPTVVDLFAGAGGLSIGFIEAGFDLIAATDFDKWSCETLRRNHPNSIVVEKDILNLSVKDFKELIGNKEVDVIIGGPPCQGFSPLGKKLKIDPRNRMAFEFLRMIEGLNPKIFVMENVPELLKSEEFRVFKEKVEKLGYQVEAKVLVASDYGVPQKRKRAIIIGSKLSKPSHPEPTHVDPAKSDLLNAHLKPWTTVRSVIEDLPLIPTGENWHIGRNPTALSLERYTHVPPGGNRFNLPLELQPDCWKNKPTGSADVFGRLWWDRPSVTIRTEFYKPEKGRYLHPEANRPITIREAARIQTFPDDYDFAGASSQVAKQIGNAVPCLLANKIAGKVLELLLVEEKHLPSNVELSDNQVLNSY